MNINFKIVSGILAAGWAYEAYANHTNAKRLLSSQRKLVSMVNYMANVLDKNEVPLDEFDRIAIEELTK